MAKRKKNNSLFWLVLGGLLILREVVKAGSLRNLLITNTQLAEMYREMIAAGTATTYTVTRGNETLYWHIDLARSTTNYEGVMKEYSRLYGRKLSNDLLEYFGDLGYIHLSEYVAELQKNGQVMLQ